MKLPLYLKFLEPLIGSGADGFGIHGHICIEKSVGGGPAEICYQSKNFIVDGGLTAVRNLLIGLNGPSGFGGSIFRMAIGDGGTPAGGLFNPKLPDSTWPSRTGLFHEVIRQDISVFSEPTLTSARFVGNFNSVDVDPSSFSISNQVINEASLVIGDGVLTVGGDKKQVNKVPADVLDADEVMLSTRTFNSVSFAPVDDVTVTVTWTITVSN